MFKMNHTLRHAASVAAVISCCLLLVSCGGGNQSEVAKQAKAAAKKYDMPELLDMPESRQEVALSAIKAQENSRVARKEDIREYARNKLKHLEQEQARRAAEEEKRRKQDAEKVDLSRSLALNDEHRVAIREEVRQLEEWGQSVEAIQKHVDHLVEDYSLREARERQAEEDKAKELADARRRQEENRRREEQREQERGAAERETQQARQESLMAAAKEAFGGGSFSFAVATVPSAKESIVSARIVGPNVEEIKDLLRKQDWLALINLLLDADYSKIDSVRTIQDAVRKLRARKFFISVTLLDALAERSPWTSGKRPFVVCVKPWRDTETPSVRILSDWKKHPASDAFITEWKTDYGEAFVAVGGRAGLKSVDETEKSLGNELSAERKTVTTLVQTGDITSDDGKMRLLKKKATLLAGLHAWLADFRDDSMEVVAANWTFDTLPTVETPIFGFNLGARTSEALEVARKYAKDPNEIPAELKDEPLHIIKYNGYPAKGDAEQVTLLFVLGRLMHVGATIPELATEADATGIVAALSEQYGCRFRRGSNPYGFSAYAIHKSGVRIMIEVSEVAAHYDLLKEVYEQDEQAASKQKYKDLLRK